MSRALKGRDFQSCRHHNHWTYGMAEGRDLSKQVAGRALPG